MRIAVLGSTRGTHLLNLANAIEQNQLSAHISLVISNKADALILKRAEQLGFPAYSVEGTRQNQEAKISKLLIQYEIDLVVLCGYMRILTAEFVRQWQKKIINVHPSLLPDFAGMMDLDVHRAVLAANKKHTGCTVHFVSEEVDGGEIILQKRIDVNPDETIEDLKARVQVAEASALIDVINHFDSKNRSLAS